MGGRDLELENRTHTRKNAAHSAQLSFSISADLIRCFEEMRRNLGLLSRSQIISKLISDAVEKNETILQSEQILTATITIVFHGHHGQSRRHIARAQIDYINEIVSSQHVFLKQAHSLEAMLVRGTGARLKALCNAIRGIRGVEQLSIVVTTTRLPNLHNRENSL